jgi:hypothetical protein
MHNQETTQRTKAPPKMVAPPNPLPLSQLDTAIRLCALANLQTALALPLLAARKVGAAGGQSLYVAVVEHVRGSLASLDALRRSPESVMGIKEALEHDTVEFSMRELQRVLDELTRSRRDVGERSALRQMPKCLDRAIRRLVATLPADSPLLAQDWSTQLEAAAAVPSAQLVHYLAVEHIGIVVRQTLHTTRATPVAANQH